MLKLKNITLSRNEKIIINNLNYVHKTGEITHIIGENGAGKTTLLKAISGILSPDNGEIKWGNTSIASCDIFQQESIYIGVKNSLSGELSAIENLSYLLALKGQNLDFNKLEKFSKILEIDGSILDRECKKLSSGQQQKISLLRLMISKSKIWILDEPLSFLDTKSKKCIMEIMQNYIDTGGSIILASHEKINIPHKKLEINHV